MNRNYVLVTEKKGSVLMDVNEEEAAKLEAEQQRSDKAKGKK